MKFTIFSLCVLAFVGFAFSDSDAGQFIPKAFYTLESNGQKSNLHQVSPHTMNYLRRLRRDSYVSSSSSSSSSISSNGGPVFFTSQQTVQHQTDQDVANRFGADNSSGQYVPGQGHKYGHTIQTTGVIDEKGHVYVHKKEGKF